MSATRWFRLISIVIVTLSAVTVSGCGHMARMAFKDGLYTYVSGSFNSGMVSTQFADFVTSFFTSTGGSVFR